MFLVIAYRMGQLNGSSHPIGVFSTYEKALEEANFHRECRGGKYDHLIFHLEEDKAYDVYEMTPVGSTGDLPIRN